MKKTYAIASITVAMLALTGCSGSHNGDQGRPVASEWKYTEIGDVLCNVGSTTEDGKITDCNWDTLTSAHERTSDDAKLMRGDWLYIERYDEKVYCLTFRSQWITDCNYPSELR